MAPAAARSARPSSGREQQESGEYTRYELLAPGTARFHILYEVTAESPGATLFWNPIRKGSTASGEAVFDRSTGLPLAFDVVSGEQARQSGLAPADPTGSYIQVRLPRPVPAGGGVRLLIEKTYEDAKTYFRAGTDQIVFSRSLGIRRNAIVLPADYELISCNIPAQVLTAPDGRLVVSFMHGGPDPAPLLLHARRLTR